MNIAPRHTHTETHRHVRDKKRNKIKRFQNPKSERTQTGRHCDSPKGIPFPFSTLSLRIDGENHEE